MEKIIGIDLGTTNSCVAWRDASGPIVIPNEEGGRTTPSVVALLDAQKRLVGAAAQRQAAVNPQNTIVAIKRLMGRPFADPAVQQDLARYAFKIAPSPRQDAWVEAQGTLHAPAEISAYILQKMKKIAEDYLGEEVKRAVITVPAYFNDRQRQATRDAGEIAGLKVERILNEPTAAALAYGLDKHDNCKIAVYDLGGGTFDISILELSSGVFNVLATNGNTRLGGEDFDQRLLKHVAERALKEQHIDLLADRLLLARLQESMQKLKHELSVKEVAELNLPFIAKDQHLKLSITRQTLEELTQDLVEETLITCRAALKDAGLKVTDLQEVLLVGGMTRMPLVRKKVGDFFQRVPNQQINPDEVVAIGAALQGAVLQGTMKDILLLDVTPLSLGIETFGGVFTKLIPRNTTIPCKKTQFFSTAEDDQELVRVHVLQGERPLAADNQTLAKLELVGIPKAPRGTPQIEVCFALDTNGIVQVSAKDLGTGKSQSLKIVAPSGLTSGEIAKIIKDAEMHSHEDSAKEQVITLQNKLTSLIYTTERALVAYDKLVETELQQALTTELQVAKKLATSTDLQEIEATFKKLAGLARSLANLVATKGA